MHGVFRRLLTLVHWLGFICLVYWLITFLGISVVALTEGLNELKYAMEDITSILAIMWDLDEAEYPLFWSLWLALAHHFSPGEIVTNCLLDLQQEYACSQKWAAPSLDIYHPTHHKPVSLSIRLTHNSLFDHITCPQSATGFLGP